MKKFYFIIAGLIGMSNWSIAGLSTEIIYTVENVAGNHWSYTYQVQNISLSEGIEEFTIWFDLGKYQNLTIQSSGVSSEWVESIWQPAPLLLDDGGYDARTMASMIPIGQSVSGFAVSFDWLSIGTPGTQYYEIINMNTVQTIDSGMTVLIPEPSCVGLMLLGTYFVRLKKRKKI